MTMKRRRYLSDRHLKSLGDKRKLRLIDLIDWHFLQVSITKVVDRVSLGVGDRLDRPDRPLNTIYKSHKKYKNLKRVSIKSISSSNRWKSKRKVIDTPSLSLSIGVYQKALSLEPQREEVSIR